MSAFAASSPSIGTTVRTVTDCAGIKKLETRLIANKIAEIWVALCAKTRATISPARTRSLAIITRFTFQWSTKTPATGVMKARGVLCLLILAELLHQRFGPGTLAVQDALDLRLLLLCEVQLFGHVVEHPTGTMAKAAVRPLCIDGCGEAGCHGQYNCCNDEKLFVHLPTPIRIQTAVSLFPQPLRRPNTSALPIVLTQTRGG